MFHAVGLLLPSGLLAVACLQLFWVSTAAEVSMLIKSLKDLTLGASKVRQPAQRQCSGAN